MKILSQNKRTISSPGQLWITWWNKGDKIEYAIFNGACIGEIGVFDSEKRAKEVLVEIFDHIKTGKSAYEVPSK